MSKTKGYMRALKCRECGREYDLGPTHVCEFDFGPLEVAYDYPKIQKSISRQSILKRPQNMWRYRELLPVEGEPTVGFQVGFTPLIKAGRLAKRLGIRELWIKNDTVNYPTLSFKDRVVSVALSRAKELGFTTVACASTGNLANSVSANASAAGLEAFVFIPSNLEEGKIVNSLIYGANVIAIKGHYDEVNRLCAEIAGKYGWAFVNVNMRPYYAEGSKSMGFEIIEQLDWTIPEHTVVCMASGSLLTKIHKSYQEFIKLGVVKDRPYQIHGAQAAGCNPISAAQKSGLDFFKPVKPDTIAKSLAIGTPADGFYALKVMKETGGAADDVSDDEIREGIKLLAECEGIFAETAGGVTVGVAKKLIASGKIPSDSSAVLCVTGHGLKTLDAVVGHVGQTREIKPSLREFETLLDRINSTRSQRITQSFHMPIKVRIPTPLRKLTNDKEEVEISADTVGKAIEELESAYPGIKERLLDDSGEIRRFVNVYVNEEDIRFVDNQKTALKEGDEISIIPAIAGG